MDNLILNNKKTMSSLEIAELTGKQHSNMMRDIRNILEQLDERHKFNFELMFKITKLGNNAERKDPYYRLTKKDCLLLASGYDANLRAKIINRWEDLETGKANPVYQVPHSFSEALMLAAQQQLQIEEQQKQISVMSTEIVEMKKKTDYLEIILSSKGTVVTTQIAQDYGMSAKAFNRLLADKGIQRRVNGQWILYAPYMSKGYVHSKSVNITHKDGRPDVKMNTEWTQRGRLFIYETLKRCDILPLIERNIMNNAS